MSRAFGDTLLSGDFGEGLLLSELRGRDILLFGVGLLRTGDTLFNDRLRLLDLLLDSSFNLLVLSLLPRVRLELRLRLLRR